MIAKAIKSISFSVMLTVGTALFANEAIYVDSLNGDDGRSGLSPAEAKKTIDAAYSAVDRHDVEIVLLPGTHQSPSGAFSTKNCAPAYRVKFIGKEGPQSTIVDGGGERCFTGCPNAFTSIEGCTLANFHCQNVNWQIFCFVSFSNCVFSGDFSRASSDHRIFFYGCRFQNCRGSINLTYGYDYDDIGSGYYYGNGTEMFYGCAAFDSVFQISTPGNPHRFDGCSYFENCFIKIGGITRLSAAGSANVLGKPQRFVNTTLLVESAADLACGGFSNCLLGLGESCDSSQLNLKSPCITTGMVDLAGNLNEDFTVKKQEWRTYGYNAEDSEADVALKASIAALSPVSALSNICDRVAYASYREWALGVKEPVGGAPAGIAAVNSSPNAYLAYAINSPTLITNEVKASDAEIVSFRPDLRNGVFTFELAVRNATIGEDALIENLANIFRLEGAPSISDGEFSKENIEVEFSQPANGRVKVEIRPKKPVASSYFFRAALSAD